MVDRGRKEQEIIIIIIIVFCVAHLLDVLWHLCTDALSVVSLIHIGTLFSLFFLC